MANHFYSLVRVLLRGRERPQPQEHRGHPGPLLPLLHSPLRPRPQADRPRVPQEAAVQSQSRSRHSQGRLSD